MGGNRLHLALADSHGVPELSVWHCRYGYGGGGWGYGGGGWRDGWRDRDRGGWRG